MTTYINGTVGRNNTTVHAYYKVGDVTPICGSGNTHNINARVYKRFRPSSHPVSCKKCLERISK